MHDTTQCPLTIMNSCVGEPSLACWGGTSPRCKPNKLNCALPVDFAVGEIGDLSQHEEVVEAETGPARLCIGKTAMMRLENQRVESTDTTKKPWMSGVRAERHRNHTGAGIS